MNENTRIVRVSHNGKILKDSINKINIVDPKLTKILCTDIIDYLDEDKKVQESTS